MFRILLITLMVGGIMANNNDLKVGNKAPDFTLLDQNNVEHTLSDYHGENIVVYFYPKDDTPGCTKEACSIRDNFSTFEKNGIRVFGISYDSPKSHARFAEKYKLPFTLLSDSEKTTAKAYNSQGLLTAKRNTFLVNKDGNIFKIYKKVDVTTHTDNILKDFLALDETDEK
ncbi:peroxiredoxin [Candidatus Neomarinimicrobiota bacterium]